MARDPWKRAYDRKRLESGGGDPRRDKPEVRWITPAPVLLAIALVALIATGLTAVWLYRAQLFPLVRGELPPTLAEHVPQPQVEVDYAALEEGVGRGLVLLGDYLELIDGTRELEPEWQIAQTGANTLRLESDGIKVYVKDGLIQTYTMDVPLFFQSERWGEWRSEWRRAGVFPELTWTMFTGEEQGPAGTAERLYSSPEALKLDRGWMHRAFNFAFRNGALARLEGRLEFGPSDSPAGG